MYRFELPERSFRESIVWNCEEQFLQVGPRSTGRWRWHTPRALKYSPSQQTGVDSTHGVHLFFLPFYSVSRKRFASRYFRSKLHARTIYSCVLLRTVFIVHNNRGCFRVSRMFTLIGTCDSRTIDSIINGLLTTISIVETCPTKSSQIVQ